ncbi:MULTISPECIES: HEXXH motif domain-containing protein [unclassified Pseudofrankia]|uniref:HEXXH motif domain-containing protein n=1 Tax=unclassified Pseudofrankia TaxID=2994372 RepID=UPI0008D9C301|nr:MULTISPECIES: HEXXH motif domain-containing protein [unclassified Pseudofrankia]MDT3444368.1 HEXXH motif domain-containing protein [Pseudofrankia sp. BMG5.37]OHV56505.1 hypothetical protein BCD48_08590 [Pseudofrankia sp. BMG5.36]
MNETHRLFRADFDALAAGGGGPSTLAALWKMQLSRRILLVHTVAEVAQEHAPEVFVAGRFAEALAVLAETRRAVPDAVADVLLNPQIGGWIMRCLRTMLDPAGERSSAESDLGHFGAVVAAAAWRAGLPFETTIRVSHGSVMIPTVGLIRTEMLDGWGRAHADGSGETLRISVGDETVASDEMGPVAGSRWLPLRQLRCVVDGRSLEIALDDVDPFRGFAGLRNADRLTSTEAAVWKARLDEAWELLVRYLPDHAEAIAAGVRCLVPLDPGPEKRKLSATSTDAPGAVGMIPPTDGLDLAVTLVHELQHTKLAVLQDAVRLCGSDDELHYAPWRYDPRPLTGMFQGVYAYLGLTEFWGVYRQAAEGPGAQLAHFEFARWREAVRRVIRWLHESSLLTALGRDFLVGMRTSIERWCAEAVPALPLALARVASAEHWTSWRLRNIHPDQTWIAAAADAWLAGQPGPDGRTAPATVRRGRRGKATEPHLELAYLRLREPDRFDALRRDLGKRDALAAALPGATVADVLLVAGDHVAATRAYQREITRTPERIEAWTGLAIAHRGLRTAGQPLLVARPETVRALHLYIGERTGTGPDPEALAGWLGESSAQTLDEHG